ncbi:DUF6380 family protein [Streptomyces sp. NBC_01304]|uniref:DUF6380 family protein n=1 Tax=Streptomyces sp. NBC_01304 TaxID=2903818 RepID=UPI003FA35F0B
MTRICVETRIPVQYRAIPPKRQATLRGGTASLTEMACPAPVIGAAQGEGA